MDWVSNRFGKQWLVILAILNFSVYELTASAVGTIHRFVVALAEFGLVVFRHILFLLQLMISVRK